MSTQRKLSRSAKVIIVVYFVGIVLIISGLSVYRYAEQRISDLEAQLSPDLSDYDYGMIKGSLDWWRPALVSIYGPISLYLMMAGITTLALPTAYIALSIPRRKEDHSNMTFMSEARSKGPGQITILAFVLTLFGLWSLWDAFQGISGDLEILSLLPNMMVHEWFRLAIPIELAIGIILMAAALIQLATVALLLARNPSAVKLALGVFISIAILNLIFGSLYVSAPLGIRSELTTDILLNLGLGIFQLIIAVYFRRNLNKPKVKIS